MRAPTSRFRFAAQLASLLLCFAAIAPAAIAQPKAPGAQPERLKVYAYTMKHQRADDALQKVRPLLSKRGSVEVHPGGNHLVVRETQAVIDRVARLLAQIDTPLEELSFEIQIIRAGPKRRGVSPPEPEGPKLSPGQLKRLRTLLRYDEYKVLAKADVRAREGDDVIYTLGQSYDVSFRSGHMLAGQRVKLEGFRIVEHASNPANKGRRLEPRELFHAHLNLWIDRPFGLVLTQNEERQEALMVAISARRETPEGADPEQRRP